MQSPVGIYGKVKGFLHTELWRGDIEHLHWPQRLAYKIIRFVYVLIREVSTGQLTLRAMSLVFTSLLSMVPLIAVSFSVLKAFGVHNQIEPLLHNLVEPLGAQGDEIVVNVLGFVENMKVGVLGSLGMALLLYTVISLIQKVEISFNYVWHAESSRTLSRRFSDYLSVIMVGPVLVFAAMGLTASMMNSDIMLAVMSVEPFGSLLVLLSRLVPFILITLAFTFVYMFVPNTRVKFGSALVGALVGGVLWQGTGLVFAEFAAGSTRYAAVYAGFAILLIFMIWLYLSWLILLIGAQVAFFHQYPERIRLADKRLPLSGRFREQVALLVMYRITDVFVHRGRPLTQEMLADQLQMPLDRVGEIVQLLQHRGLLVETASEPPEFLLGQDPATLGLAQLLVTIRSPREEQAQLEGRVESTVPVDTLLSRMDQAINEAMGDATLRDLVTREADAEAAPV
ncbi:YihY/virulence factor BrkB family protein [Haliea sp. E1-2-M8]|uniref:YihY/virulence factor BrkB family protein n=1 Tax=Haliea sp. E1-2-M8 TaxID=3064706 RepID=UPI00271E60C7|nr:YihY/virulence factor BrkB family protein [Haliea sp. E1-2-M8]MDO8863433.1 YihY/virulence factor BrkB family protein [Haliea sp. E1-2-M8]